MAYKAKADQHKASREHYLRNKDKIVEKKSNHRRLASAYVRETKTGKACLDCRNEFEWFQFDYHHRKGTVKRAAIYKMVSYGYSIESIIAEILKCDLICANCHRLRHREDYVTKT